MPDEQQRPTRPRLEPRLVFALVLVAIPVLWIVGQVILVRAGEECTGEGTDQVGGLVQMFVPGDSCTPPDVAPTGR